MLKLNKDLFIDKKKDWQKNYSHYLILMVKYYICGFILMNLSSQILIFITKSIPLNEMENREIIATYPIYAILNAGIIGPICEEIAFRGTFKRIIQNKKIYVLLTGFIFGLAHVIF